MSQSTSIPGDDSNEPSPLSEGSALRLIAALLAEEGGDLDVRASDAVLSTRYLVQGTELTPSSIVPILAAKLKRLRQLEAEFQQQLEREKLAAMRGLAYGASHEINNPLANIASRAQTLLRDETDPEKRRKLATINAQAFRAHEMIADMMLFANPPQPRLAAVDLVQLAQTVVAELQPDATEQATNLVFAGEYGSLTAAADATQIQAALRAICQNSLEALSAGGRIEVSVRAANDQAEISVLDTGPGLSDEVRRHLFDPFFSGREAGRGLGLGLSKCWRIVEMHGGQIVVESQPGRGAKFSILLPLAGL